MCMSQMQTLDNISQWMEFIHNVHSQLIIKYELTHN
jgi:hypothetical protein